MLNQGLVLISPVILVRLLTVEEFGRYREFLLYAGVQVWMSYFWGDPGRLRKTALPGPMTLITVIAVVLVALLPAVSGPVYELAAQVAENLDGNGSYLAALFPDGNPALSGGD